MDIKSEKLLNTIKHCMYIYLQFYLPDSQCAVGGCRGPYGSEIGDT